MIPSIRDIAFKLRQGHLIALADETGWSIAADPANNVTAEQLLAFLPAMPGGLQLTVLIQNTDQLGLYVAKVPEIAYDLVEFAENPLIVLYDKGKNLSPVVEQYLAEQGTGGLAVRRALHPDVQQLLGSFGRGLLTIPLESNQLPAGAEALISVQFSQLIGPPKRPRIMRLSINGEVSFIRK